MPKELDLVGFSRCGRVEEDFVKFYMDYIKKGYNGEMKYLEKNIEKRFNPENLLKGAKTIISLGVNYYSKIDEKSIFPRYFTSYNRYRN